MSSQPAFSHAAQLIPLVRELERRGHSVTVATARGFARSLISHGLDARPFGCDWEIRPGDETYDRTVGLRTFFGFPEVPDQSSVRDLTRVAAPTGAQLIVREYSEFTGWAVAASMGITLVTQGIIHRLPPEGEARVATLAAHVASLAGVPSPRSFEELLGSALLDVVPPSFRWPWEHGARRAVPARPSLFDGSVDEEPPSWLTGLGHERPLVYATLGTIYTESPSLWRVVLSALSRLAADAIVTTGRRAAAERIGQVPSNVRVERYVPQSHLLPRCRAVVCHAGFNTLIGAFTPRGPQPVLADRRRPANPPCRDLIPPCPLSSRPTCSGPRALALARGSAAPRR